MGWEDMRAIWMHLKSISCLENLGPGFLEWERPWITVARIQAVHICTVAFATKCRAWPLKRRNAQPGQIRSIPLFHRHTGSTSYGRTLRYVVATWFFKSSKQSAVLLGNCPKCVHVFYTDSFNFLANCRKLPCQDRWWMHTSLHLGRCWVYTFPSFSREFWRADTAVGFELRCAMLMTSSIWIETLWFWRCQSRNFICNSEQKGKKEINRCNYF